MECIIYQRVKKSGISHTHIKFVVAHILHELKKTGDVSIHLIGDQRMQTLNKKYRGINSTTDVLSFAAQEGMHMPTHDVLGDVFISIPRIRAQARAYKITYREEFIRMLIHSILHMVGYNHIHKKQAKIMFELQEKLILLCKVV